MDFIEYKNIQKIKDCNNKPKIYKGITKEISNVTNQNKMPLILLIAIGIFLVLKK